MKIRDFDPDRDLDEVLELVGRSLARLDRGALLHPGDLQWGLRRTGLPGFRVAVMMDGGRISGLALCHGSDVLMQSDDAHRGDHGALLEFVEAAAGTDRQGELFLSVADDDPDLRTAAAARGYAVSDRRGYELVRDLTGEPDSPSLPPGFGMTSLDPALDDAYVQLHRAEWSRPGRPSTYDERQHRIVLGMPDFRYDLVPIVRAPDGSLAASCISWWDPRSSSVEIEPLGTHPAFRRMGLARAVVHEVFRRASKLGAKYVLVWGTSSLPEAKALYESAGMRTRRVLRDHRLAL